MFYIKLIILFSTNIYSLHLLLFFAFHSWFFFIFARPRALSICIYFRSKSKLHRTMHRNALNGYTTPSIHQSIQSSSNFSHITVINYNFYLHTIHVRTSPLLTSIHAIALCKRNAIAARKTHTQNVGDSKDKIRNHERFLSCIQKRLYIISVHIIE